MLVDILLKTEELRPSCIKALVLFGNLALEPIETALNEMATGPSIDFILEPLAAINTGSSAVSIAIHRLGIAWAGDADHPRPISSRQGVSW
jgi:hypothetical protein